MTSLRYYLAIEDDCRSNGASKYVPGIVKIVEVAEMGRKHVRRIDYHNHLSVMHYHEFNLSANSRVQFVFLLVKRRCEEKGVFHRPLGASHVFSTIKSKRFLSLHLSLIKGSCT